MDNKKGKVVFTIAAKNYLAHAISLGDSIRKFHPELDFYILLSDEKDEAELQCKYPIIESKDLMIDGFYEMAFMYDIIEFSTSVKPFFIEKLFAQGYAKVLYLDPDMMIYNKIDSLFDELNDHDALLTPHLLKPYFDYKGATSEEELLFVGIYNLGFFGIKNSMVGNHIIGWWKRKLRHQCFADKIDALHVDQRWMDFLPPLYGDSVKILRHPGVNMAFWNIHERAFTDDGKEYLVDGLPLIIFHFSGLDIFNIKGMCRKQDKYNLNKNGEFIRLFNEYAAKLKENNIMKFLNYKYYYDSFDNGVRIIKYQRRLFRAFINSNSLGLSPFSSGDGSFYSLLNKNKLLIFNNAEKYTSIRKNIKGVQRKVNMMFYLLRIVIGLIGIKRYYLLTRFFYYHSRFEDQLFLIKEGNL